MDQKTQSVDQIVQRLEALKAKLGDKKDLAGEIDQISQSVRQAVGSGSQTGSQKQDNPSSR